VEIQSVSGMKPYTGYKYKGLKSKIYEIYEIHWLNREIHCINTLYYLFVTGDYR